MLFGVYVIIQIKATVVYRSEMFNNFRKTTIYNLEQKSAKYN